MEETQQAGTTATLEKPAGSQEGLMPTPGAATPPAPELNPTAAADVNNALNAGGVDTLGAAVPPVVEPPTVTSEAASPLNPLMPVGTPGRESLDATHQQMVSQKADAAAAAPSKPLHQRIFGALGFGGGKSETPAQPAATPGDHLTPTGNGTLETQPMANVTPEAASAASSPTPELNPTAMADINSAASGVDSLPPAGEPAPAMETPTSTTAPAEEVGTTSAESIGSTMPETTTPMAETPAPATPIEPSLNATATADVNEALSAGGADTLGAPTPETPDSSQLSSPDPAGGLDLERTAQPMETPAEAPADTHADPLQVGPVQPAPSETGASEPTIPDDAPSTPVDAVAPPPVVESAPVMPVAEPAPDAVLPTIEPVAPQSPMGSVTDPAMPAGVGEPAPLAAAPEIPSAQPTADGVGEAPPMGTPEDPTNTSGGTGTQTT